MDKIKRKRTYTNYDELMKLINHFSEIEIKEIILFLKSPFFHCPKSVFLLFKILSGRRTMFLNKPIDYTAGYAAKKMELGKKTIINLMTSLSQLLRQYIKITEIMKDVFEQENRLNRYFLKRGLYRLVDGGLKKADYLFTSQKLLNAKMFYELFLHNEIKFDYSINISGSTEIKTARNSILTLNNAVENLSLYSLIQITSAYINFCFDDIEKIRENKEKFPLNLDRIFNFIEESSLFKTESLQKEIYNIYRNMYYAFRNFDLKNYYEIYRDSFNKYSDVTSPETERFHLEALMNYCILHEHENIETEYYKNEEMNYLKEYIVKGLFKKSEIDYLSPVLFRNFVTLVFSMGEFQLLKDNIQNVAAKLNPQDFENFLNYGLAYYYLGVNKFEKAIKHAEDTNFRDTVYRFDLINILIRANYSLGRFNIIYNIIHKYRGLINRNRLLTTNEKNALKKMLYYLTLIIERKTSAEGFIEDSFAEILIKSINVNNQIGLKNWLIEQVENLRRSVLSNNMKTNL